MRLDRFNQAADTTPVGRDRFVDTVRVFSIGAVVLGHWFMAVPHYSSGSFSATNALSAVGGLWILTWVFQVMPLFFFVGGFSNSVTVDSMQRKGLGYSNFVTSRVLRIMGPVLVLLGVWAAIAVVLGLTGVRSATINSVTMWITQPLWFVAVYVVLIAMAPAMLTLHKRHGLLVPATLVTIAAVVDWLRLVEGVGGAGYVNLLVVWLFAQQLGFFYADGRLQRIGRTGHVLIAATGASALVFLVAVAGYPGSMVGQAGDKFSNMSPPTLAIVALTLCQVGVAMLLRSRINAVLQRPRVWATVIAGNTFAMTLYLWHLSALIIAVVVLYPLGFPQLAAGSVGWLAMKPIWLLIAAVPLVVLVAIFDRFDRNTSGTASLSDSAANRGLIVVAVAGIAFGTLGLAFTSLDGLGELHGGRTIGGFTLNATLPAALLLLGVIMTKLATAAHLNEHPFVSGPVTPALAELA